MSRLLIIDQSLKGVGGHHYDYTLQTSCAAAKQGLEVIAVTNSKFGGCRKIGSFAQIVPHFSKTTYYSESLLNGLRTVLGNDPVSKSCPKEWISSLDLISPQIHNPAAAPNQVAAYEKSNRLLAYQKTLIKFLRRNGFIGNRKFWKENKRRRKWVQLFRDSCRRLFDRFHLGPDDHVFFTTINDIELAGLIEYWAGSRTSNQPTWHLQFHFEIFEGRPYTHKHQLPFASPLKKLFQQIDRVVPYHHVRFYGTTESIVNQYKQISCFDVQELTYPISGCSRQFESGNSFQATPNLSIYSPEQKKEEPFRPIFLADPETAAGNQSGEVFHKFPLKISIAGGIRGEKGQGKIQRILPGLCEKLFDTGLAKLSLQRKNSKKLIKKKPFRLDLPSGTDPSCVEYLPHPLSADAYSDFISETDIGLITYDPEAYHSRRAGVFCEYLAAGVPVVAPAACWMADEIQKIDELYRDEILKQFEVQESWTYKHLQWSQWNLPTGGGKINFDGVRSPAQAKGILSEETTDQNRLMHIGFHWLWHKLPGYYLEIQAKFLDQSGAECSTQKVTLGNKSSGSQGGTLVEVPKSAREVYFGFSNACGEETLSIDRLRIDLLHTGQQQIPLGCIGRTFRNENEIPELLEHICHHYSHYRYNTRMYRSVWQETHNPHRTVMQLTSADPEQKLAFAS